MRRTKENKEHTSGPIAAKDLNISGIATDCCGQADNPLLRCLCGEASRISMMSNVGTQRGGGAGPRSQSKSNRNGANPLYFIPTLKATDPGASIIILLIFIQAHFTYIWVIKTGIGQIKWEGGEG